MSRRLQLKLRNLGWKKRSKTRPACTEFEYDSCDVKTDLQTSHKISNSTQTKKIIVEDKLVQACVQISLSDKQAQTIGDPIRCKSTGKNAREHLRWVLLDCLYMDSFLDLLDSYLDFLLDSPHPTPTFLIALRDSRILPAVNG